MSITKDRLIQLTKRKKVSLRDFEQRYEERERRYAERARRTAPNQKFMSRTYNI